MGFLVCLFVCLFVFGHANTMWKIPGQGSNPHHSSNPSCCRDNAGSSTHCTTRELLALVVLVWVCILWDCQHTELCHLQIEMFTCSFPILMRFIFLSSLIALNRTFSTMLNSTPKSRHLWHVLHFKGFSLWVYCYLWDFYKGKKESSLLILVFWVFSLWKGI